MYPDQKELLGSYSRIIDSREYWKQDYFQINLLESSFFVQVWKLMNSSSKILVILVHWFGFLLLWTFWEPSNWIRNFGTNRKAFGLFRISGETWVLPGYSLGNLILPIYCAMRWLFRLKLEPNYQAKHTFKNKFVAIKAEAPNWF